MAKPLQDARDILASETAADHHRNLFATEAITCRDHTAMPETPDSTGSAPAIAKAAFFADHSRAERWAELANEEGSGPADQGQRHQLAPRQCATIWVCGAGFDF